LKIYGLKCTRAIFKSIKNHISDGQRVSVAIANGKILEGKLNARQKELIKAWMIIHREEIWDRWNKAVSGEYIEKIPPRGL
jgi:hypothetical protein